MKKLLLLVMVCSSIDLFAQALYPVPNAEKAANATLIIEGEVISQQSFWNDAHTMIFTANTIRVTKVFKGAIQGNTLEVMTHGGTVGNTNITASDLLELNKGEVGVFFCFPNTAGIHGPSGNVLMDVYASAQGFVKYNVTDNRAADPFNTYSSIKDELYPLLNTLSGRSYQTLDPAFQAGHNKQMQGRPNAFVSGISPRTLNAGATADPTNNVLTITGSGFGNTPSGSAAVLFNDANYDPSSGMKSTVAYTSNLIVSWTDTEIKVKVPSRAGTGFVSVRDAAGAISNSPVQLNIFYSILSFTADNITKQSNLSNANGSGGYTMQYSSNMTAEAVATFNRALQTWIDVCGANITPGSTTSTSSVSGDSRCVVMMDNANANSGTPLSAGVLAVCYSFNSYCSPASSFDYRKPEFDVVIRSSYSSGSTQFELGPCPPSSGLIDLETVLLHELGHGLNLGHIIAGSQGLNANPPKLMNYAVSNGVKRTSLDASAYRGGLYTCSTNPSVVFGLCTSATSMIQNTPNVDSKDDCPVSFPSSPTPPGTQVAFDLEHSTSNNNGDPQYNNILCSSTGTAVTNNLYYVVRTDASGDVAMDVTDFAVTPASASSCSGSGAPAARIAVFQVDACPTGQLFPSPIACRTILGNGPVTTISGLSASTNYLFYVDGRFNSKVSFKITFNGSALPLKLERFTGEVKPSFNELRWVIASFSEVSRLLLQRSTNGSEFSNIMSYDGNLAINRQYTYADKAASAGNNYYRLAIYNKDGSVQYSQVVLLRREVKVSVNVYPNPVKEVINVRINAAVNEGRLQLRLYNNIGQLMVTQRVLLTAGNQRIDLPAERLAPGSYRLVITDADEQVISTSNLQKQ